MTLGRCPFSFFFSRGTPPTLSLSTEDTQLLSFSLSVFDVFGTGLRFCTLTLSQIFFVLTLVTGPRRSLSLKLRDTRVHEPQIRDRLGTTAQRFLTGFSLSQIRSGGAVINDCLMGETQTELPFGGVGSFRFLLSFDSDQPSHECSQCDNSHHMILIEGVGGMLPPVLLLLLYYYQA